MSISERLKYCQILNRKAYLLTHIKKGTLQRFLVNGPKPRSGGKTREHMFTHKLHPVESLSFVSIAKGDPRKDYTALLVQLLTHP